MEIFSAVYDDSIKNVYAISLVGNPAMKGNLVKLSENEQVVKLATVSEERREVMGMVLEPEKVIPRTDANGNVYGITFNSENIRKLSRDFYKSKSNDKSTIEHKGEFIDDVYFCESWIVEDSEKDKSAAYGLSYPKGTWLATMKIDNDQIWSDYVETGKVTGFSIDSVLKFEKLNNVNMSEEAKKVEEPAKDETKTILSEIKTFLSELRDKGKKVEEPAKVELSEDLKVELSAMVDKATEPLKTELSEVNTKLSEVTAEKEALAVELAAEKEKVVELSKKPATDKIVPKKVKKEYKDMTPAEQMKFNRENS